MRTGVVIAERFVVERLIGSGGMGSVFLATDRLSGLPVAVKVLALSSEGGVERFRREARVLAELSHPAIVRYISHGETESREPFLAMELLEGEDLSERLSRGPLSVDESLGLVRRACQALSFAHSNGVIHRDVKPSNLFLVGHDLGRIKVLDFGIARERLQTQGLTQSGTMLGTVGYMAPEQATGASSADARADVFALGCVLFECLTGQPTFSARHAIAVLAKVMSEEAPRVSDVRPELGLGFDDLLGRMLAKNPDQRPKDAGEVVEALDALIASVPVPVRTRPPTSAASVSHREQRIVSVLLAEGLLDDGTLPESGGELARDHLARMRQVAERTGAELTLLQGGGLLLIVSGRGGAHDQAIEAANAALALQRMLPGLRMALATGSVDGTNKRPVGPPIDRAATLLRMSGDPRSGAKLGGVLLDDVTVGLLGSRFEIERIGDHSILLGERDDFEAVRLFLGKPTPTVGREKELALCEGTLTECVEESVSRALLLTAPPGIGKSRLASDMARHTNASGRARVLVARASPVGAGAPLALVQVLLRKAIGLTADLSTPQQHSMLRAYVAARMPEHADGPVTDFLAEVAGVPLDPAADSAKSPFVRAARNDPAVMQEQKRRAFASWIDAETARGPLLIVIEDLHWGDASTVSYLDDALKDLACRPLMVLATSRPEVHERFPKLWSAVDLQELRLGGLTRRPAERLVRAVLGEQAEADVVARIIDRADGNAFYLEELVRRVAEGSETLPETVLAMAQSRLERLEPDARRVLRAASVYGETCSLGAVVALLSSTLDTQGWLEALVGREFLSRSPEVRHPGERQYVFRHALLRDAAYAMLTDGDRRNAHGLAAAWLERNGEREPRIIAEHFEAGGDSNRAVAWLCRAARAALDSGDMPQAIEVAQRGRALGASHEELGLLAAVEGLAAIWINCPSLPLLREAIALLPRTHPLWWSAVGSGIYSTATSERAADAAEFVQHVFGPPPAELTGPYGMAINGVSAGLLALRQTEAAHAFLAQFDSGIADDPNSDPLFSAWLDSARGYADQLSVRDGAWQLERSRMFSRRAAEKMSACGALVGESTALFYAMGAAIVLGLYDEAEDAAQRSLILARRAGADLVRIYVRLMFVQMRTRAGRLNEALSALESLEPTADAAQAQYRDVLLAEVRYDAGRLIEARAPALAASQGLVAPTSDWGHSIVARICFGLGELDHSIEVTHRVPTSLPHFDADLLATRAQALSALGRHEEARAAAELAREAILGIARHISDPEIRTSFLTNSVEASRALSVARNLLG